jgi:hypothetical protein
MGVRRGAGRRTLSFAVVLALVSFGTTTVTEASGARTARTGLITGTVTNDSKVPAPVAGICVSALTRPAGRAIGHAKSASDGRYTITGVPPGTYSVRFVGCGAADYITRYYKNGANLAGATPVKVTSGSTTAHVGVHLVLGGHISGTVTDSSATPVPLKNVCVRVRSVPAGSTVAATTTRADGSYSAGYLSPGSYAIEFVGCEDRYYVTQYYNHRPTLATANRVKVTSGARTSNIGARLVLAGDLTGRVTTDSAPPAPLARICVTAARQAGGDRPVGERRRSGGASADLSATTDSHGNYAFDDILAGSYAVTFADCLRHVYLPTGGSIYENVVAGSTTAHVDETMAKPGRISGTVTSASPGGPLGAVCVVAYNGEGLEVSGADSVRNGSYTLKGLLAGTYTVEFLDCIRRNYLTQFFDDQSTMAAANPVTVLENQTTINIGAAMAAGGRISGKVVSSAGGQPIAGINVNAVGYPFTGYGPFGNALTNAKGTYAIKGLPSGNYVVTFNSTEVAGWSSQYYDNQTNINLANPVSVSAPLTTGRCNAQLTPQ